MKLLEICIDSAESALAAKNGGADRLEVCSSLAAGGTTPSHALTDYCVQTLGMPSMMMIRPHDGGFVYCDEDLKIMISSIETAKRIGVQGIVFGVLTSDRKIDIETCKRLIDAADGQETTFHRAIDIAVNPVESVQQLEELGFSRVLTSGQKATAFEGATTIRKMVDACTNMSILAGAGVNASNVADLIARTGVSEVHASASVSVDESRSETEVSFGSSRRCTCADAVRELKRVMR